MTRWPFISSLLLLASVFISSVSCSGGPEQKPDERVVATIEGKTASEAIDTEMLDPPFSAQEIRAAQWAGKKTVYRIEESGEPPVLRLTNWVEVTDDWASFQAVELNLDQKPVGEPMTAKATWEELAEHAQFPADRTTVSEASVTVPAGSFDAWLYEVRAVEDDSETMTRAWFAKARPGPPVRLEQSVEGAQVYRMVLVSESERQGQP